MGNELSNRGKKILLIGTFDTKGEEYEFIKGLIESRGHQVITVNTGVMGPAECIKPDYDADSVASAAGTSLDELQQKQDRGLAMTVMSKGASVLIRDLYNQGIFHGILGMGGTGGTSVISAAMRNLPVRVPKVLVSTAASGDTRAIIDTANITLIPSIVDVAGLNRISRIVFEQAAGAVCGMVEMTQENVDEGRPIVAITMFGNTTECVNRCREQLSQNGYECLVFHCTGTGGRTMEGLIRDGLVSALLDITTTEWADELCGGVFSAGPHRLEAAGDVGIPHLIVPGCIDMVNFGGAETIPDKYKNRKFVIWNPTVTLMRTNVEENTRLGEIFADKANAARGPVQLLLPQKGVSILDREGNDFWWPEADQAMFSSLKSNLRKDIPVTEMETNINDSEFADQAVTLFLNMIKSMPSKNQSRENNR